MGGAEAFSPGMGTGGETLIYRGDRPTAFSQASECPWGQGTLSAYALPLRGASTCWVPSFHVSPSWPHSCFLVSLPINSLSTSPCLGCTFPKNTDKSGAVLNLPLEWHPQPSHQSDNVRASLCGIGGR